MEKSQPGINLESFSNEAKNNLITKIGKQNFLLRIQNLSNLQLSITREQHEEIQDKSFSKIPLCATVSIASALLLRNSLENDFLKILFSGGLISSLGFGAYYVYTISGMEDGVKLIDQQIHQRFLGKVNF